MRRVIASAFAHGCLAALVAIAASRPADGQLGRLKKVVKEKAKAGVGLSADDTRQERFRLPEGTPEITAAAVEQYLAIVAAAEPAAEQAAREYPGWKSEQLARARENKAAYEADKRAYKEKKKAYDAEMEVYGKKAEAHMKCQLEGLGGAVAGAFKRGRTDPAVRAYLRLPKPERARIDSAMGDATMRAEAAGSEAARERIMDAAFADYARALGVTPAEVKATHKSLKQAGAEMEAASTKCGPEPEPPVEPEEPVDPSDLPSEAEFVSRRVGAALEKARLPNPHDGVPGTFADGGRLQRFVELKKQREDPTTEFTEAEIQVLEARLDDLARVFSRKRRVDF